VLCAIKSVSCTSLSKKDVHHGIAGEDHPENLDHRPNEWNPCTNTAQTRSIDSRDNESHNSPANYCLNSGNANVQKHDYESVFEVAFHQRRPHSRNKVEAAEQNDGPQNREPPNVICVI
jgi:hypothetical protein